MTWTLKVRGAGSPKLLEFLCDAHGHFDAVVMPSDGDVAPCPACSAVCPWSPTVAPAGRVKKFEVSRGGWQKPERKTWLDTRNLGEGQCPVEFRDDRAAIREEQRKAEVMRLMKES